MEETSGYAQSRQGTAANYQPLLGVILKRCVDAISDNEALRTAGDRASPARDCNARFPTGDKC